MARMPTRRYALFAALYVSEGAPIGFLWWALPTRLRASGVDVESITALTSLLTLPWALKFLWAPAVDVLRGPRLTRVGWIALAQVGMGLSLVPLVVLDLARDFSIVCALLLAHGFLAATQDVAVDALCIANLRPDERGRANAWMQGGMLVGRGAFGGGALLLASYVGMPAVVLALVACILLSLVLLVRWRHLVAESEREDRAGDFGRGIRALLSAPRTCLALAFAATAGAAYEGAAQIAGPFMLDRGASERAVGVFFAAPSLVAMATGAALGGWLADRRGHGRATIAAQLAVIAVVAGLAGLEARGPSHPVAAFAAFSALYLAIGAFTAASYAMLMHAADGPARATAFSAFMGMTNLCELWSARVMGAAHTASGYRLGFALLAAASLGALALTWLLARSKPATTG